MYGPHICRLHTMKQSVAISHCACGCFSVLLAVIKWLPSAHTVVWFWSQKNKRHFFVNNCLFSSVFLLSLVAQNLFFSFFLLHSHVTSCLQCVIGTRKVWLLLRVGNFQPSGIDSCDSITWCIWLCMSLQNVTCGKIVFFPPSLFHFCYNQRCGD